MSNGADAFWYIVLYFIGFFIISSILKWRHDKYMASTTLKFCNTPSTETPEEYLKRMEDLRLQKENKERIKYSNWAEDVHMTEYLQTMNPLKFEELICYLYTRMGYETELTTATGDHGVDLFVYKDDKKIAIQCKRVISKVGEPVIRDLYGAMHDSGADAAIIVTTGSVSKQAKAWIQNKPIEIIELLALRKLIGQHIPKYMVDIPKEVIISTRSKTYCPRCGNSMRMIDTKNGSFYGCRSYPSCRYTISAKRFNRANSLKRPWD